MNPTDRGLVEGPRIIPMDEEIGEFGLMPRMRAGRRAIPGIIVAWGDSGWAGAGRDPALRRFPGRGRIPGGLLALARSFDRILERAAEMARICSADPLCREHMFRPGQVVGAACHACCLISETSCEHRNFWLDRQVLLETGWL